MKNLFIGIFFLVIAFNAFSKDYPVKNYQYINEYEVNSELSSSEVLLIVFSNSSCLESTYPDRGCMMFEKKLDYYVPSFISKIKVVAVDLYFDNYSLPQLYQISTMPTVIMFINGQEVARELSSTPDDLLNRVLSMVRKVNP